MILTYELVEERPSMASVALQEPIRKSKTRLRAEYVKAKLKIPLQLDQSDCESMAALIPRYARVNTIKMSIEECVRTLGTQGFAEITAGCITSKNADPTGSRLFSRDEHIEGLLVFAPGTDLTKNSLYKGGALVLQDKASCMPPFILAPSPGGCVVDACAAPGNKTSQLAALVGAEGAVFAFERDPKRHAILSASMKKHGCARVVPTLGDFLKTNPSHYAKVEYALVDPSCSGSGILDAHEESPADPDTQGGMEERLRKLSNFQCMIIRHAMKCKLL